jgi:hypothetical protein
MTANNYSFNATNSSWQNETEYSDDVEICCMPGLERIIVPVIFAVVILTGCVGNSLVIVVLMRNHRQQMRVSTNVLMLNLAVADMLFLIFCIPFHAIIYTKPDWPFGDFMCRFVHLMQFSSMFSSIFTLVAMAVDRYLAVRFPIHTKLIRSTSAAIGVCVAIWIASFCIALPGPIFYTVKRYTQYGPVPIEICADDWGNRRCDRPTFFLIVFLLGYAVPLLTIFVLSILTVINLWKGQAPVRTNMVESIRNKRKVTRLVIVLVVVFGICWLPYHIAWIWVNYFPETFQNTYSFYYFRVFSYVLSYANSAMNPVIYALLSENFRKYLCYSVRFELSRTLNNAYNDPSRIPMTSLRRTVSQKDSSTQS